MPPKKRLGLSLRTSTAKRLASIRLRESEEERATRLRQTLERASARRSTESADERTRRLQENSARITATRQTESEDAQAKRRRESSSRMVDMRREESEDERVRRRAENSSRLSEVRQDESEEDRARRRIDNSARMATSRQEQSVEARTNRLERQQQRTSACRRPSASSCFSAPGAAFSYDPNKEYDKDPIIQIGNLTVQCRFCGAQKFPGETPGMCCSNGKVKLSLLEPPPQPLQDLLDVKSEHSKHFLDNIRHYNSAFQMTSFGATREVVEPGFMPTFKVQGQVYHLIGSLLPQANQPAKFLQIYFMGNSEQESDRRCENFRNLNNIVVASLQNMLHVNNSLVRSFKMAVESSESHDDFRVVIRADKRPAGAHAGRFNAPATNEVAVLLMGDQHERRDIVVHSRDTRLQRIYETHPAYDGLQYPLIFWQGQEGYHFNIPQVNPTTSQPVASKKVLNIHFLYLYKD